MNDFSNSLAAFTDASFHSKSRQRRHKAFGGIVYCSGPYPLYGLMANCSNFDLTTSDEAELLVSILAMALSLGNDRIVSVSTDNEPSVQKLYSFQSNLQKPRGLTDAFLIKAADNMKQQKLGVDFSWLPREDEFICMAHSLAVNAHDIEPGVQRVMYPGTASFELDGVHMKWDELAR